MGWPVKESAWSVEMEVIKQIRADRRGTVQQTCGRWVSSKGKQPKIVAEYQ